MMKLPHITPDPVPTYTVTDWDDEQWHVLPSGPLVVTSDPRIADGLIKFVVVEREAFLVMNTDHIKTIIPADSVWLAWDALGTRFVLEDEAAVRAFREKHMAGDKTVTPIRPGVH